MLPYRPATIWLRGFSYDIADKTHEFLIQDYDLMEYSIGYTNVNREYWEYPVSFDRAVVPAFSWVCFFVMIYTRVGITTQEQGGFWMKSLRTELIVIIGGVVLLVCLLLGGAATYIAGEAMMTTTNNQLEDKALDAAQIVAGVVEKELVAMDQNAAKASIADPSISDEVRVATMKADVERNGFVREFFIRPDGSALYFDGSVKDLKDREYFTEAIQGKRFFSDTIVSKTDGSVVVAFAVPVTYEGKIVGVLGATREAGYLSKMIENVNMGGTSYTMIVSDEGVVQAHQNTEMVKSQYNFFKEQEKDPSLSEVNALLKSIFEGKSGYGNYHLSGEAKSAGYAPVPGVDWGVVVTLPESEAMYGANITRNWVIGLSGILLLFGIGASVYIGFRLSTPHPAGIQICACAGRGGPEQGTASRLLETQG